MSESQVWLAVCGLAALGVALMLILLGSYNSLIRARTRLEQALSSIDILLQQRHDLIPGLVAIVQRAASSEHRILTDVIALRGGLLGRSAADRERLAGEASLTAALGQITVLAEAYPALKSNEGFLRLQASLHMVEDQIAAARRACAAAIARYNDLVDGIPTLFAARLMGFKSEPPLEVLPHQKQNPNVNDLFRIAE
jgi:LemA protein